MPFWSPATQQHQWFLPVLPGNGRINASSASAEIKVFMWLPTLCICERIWAAGFLQARSQQPLYRGQLKPIPCSPCHMHTDSTEAPPPIWTAAIQW